MDDRFHIRLGDDQEVRAVEEGEDFRRRQHRVLALAQDANIRIGKNAEAAALAALDHGVIALAGIGIFAHAEEGEVVVAQPAQEGQRFVAVAPSCARAL